VAFQIVGVQFDQTGDQERATAVDMPRHAGRTIGYIGNFAVHDMQRSLHRAFGQDQNSIGKDSLGHWW
jgi:hypothetical protein